MKISVFTVIMGKYSVGDAARELAQIGYDGIEWRVHPDFHIRPDELDKRAVEDLYGVPLDTTGFAGEPLRSGTQDEVSIHDKLLDDITFLKSCLNERS
jgi:sugar phosphate isomerase/epimerase